MLLLTAVGALRAVLACTLAGCLTSDPCPEAASQPEAAVAGMPLRVISYNVGNAAREPPGYELRIREQAYEDLLAARLRERGAEVIALQEVLSPARCATVGEVSPAATCYGSEARPPPVRRLLGADFSIACDPVTGDECVGVHSSFGRIVGLPVGGLDLAGAAAAPLPGAPCDYLDGQCAEEASTCDRESSISYVDLETARGPLRIVHVHPTVAGRRCRTQQVAQAFHLAEGASIVLGDWNFDPEAADALVESAVHERFVGDGRRFRSHHPRDGACRLTPTHHDRAYDRVLTDFARGTCRVWASPRLDDGWNGSVRADHRAVECDLLDGR